MKRSKTCWKLKEAIAERFGSQAKGSVALHIPETRLSKIVRGRVLPSVEEFEALSKALGKHVVSQLVEKTPRPSAMG